MIDHPPEHQMDADHAEFAAANGAERLDEIGAVGRQAGRSAGDNTLSGEGIHTEDSLVREAVALAGVLSTPMPFGEALRRALSIGSRLLPSACELAVYAPDQGGDAARIRWARLAYAMSSGGNSGAGEAGASDSVGRCISPRTLSSHLIRRAHQEHTAFRAGGATCLPLLFVAADGTTTGPGGVLAVHWDEAATATSSRDTTALSLLAPCCAALLARRAQAGIEQRLVASLALIQALQGRLPPVEPAVETGETPTVTLPGDLAVLRLTAAALGPLLGASGGWVLVPSDEGTWRAYVIHALSPAYASSRPGADPHVDLDDADVEDAASQLLDGAQVQPLIAAVGDRDLVTLEHSSPIATGLRPHFAAAGPYLPDESSASTVLLLPVRVGAQVAALIVLETPAAVRVDSEVGTSAALRIARAELALAGATLLALRLSRDSSAHDKARDAFVSLTVHELRSPLTAVKGYAQLLVRQARRLGVPEQMGQAVAAIDEQATRMADMISEMHDAVRIRRGDLELHPEPVDLGPLVTRVVEQQRKLFSQHAIALATYAEPLHGEWDPQRLEQVVAALVSNAARFSPGGGEVDVEVIRAELEGRPVARIRVRDRGVGVAEVDRERIFEYLYRAPDAQRRHLSGLGLGLFVSRTLAERMGGALWLEESRTGSTPGSTFCLLLPLLDPR